MFNGHKTNQEIKLNIGCGTDYRDGFVNIDGSDTLSRVDKIIELSQESLLLHYKEASLDFILANDIIEHNFHWEAVNILNDFYKILKKDGLCKIKVPDCEFIINTDILSVQEKLLYLFGGQDIPQGNDEMNISRRSFPQFFCHKYGWTKSSMSETLTKIGFEIVSITSHNLDFIVVAKK